MVKASEDIIISKVRKENPQNEAQKIHQSWNMYICSYKNDKHKVYPFSNFHFI